MNLVVRNYIGSALVVTVCSVMLGNFYSQPSRLAGQEKVDTFGRYISAGLVAQAQTLGQ